MAATTDRPMVEALQDGDWHRCGACGTRGPLGFVAVKDGARFPCKNCGTWNRVPVPQVNES